MSVTMRGGADFNAFLAALPQNIERNVLRTALKAGADVFAEGAREECRSEEVRGTIQTSSRSEKGIVTAKIQTKGDGAFKAPWLEFGTDPHFISVDDDQTGGKTVRRINLEAKRGSLVIGGMFVGSTVYHPGARPYPFMRPAVDTRETAAIAAISAHIAGKMTRAGIETPAPEDPAE
ncbi:HK97 gp10 family phage protein [Sphingomonas arantia]|uniref:HK97 gp10 family phage protein n=1 Tax=Sphingomonas arantia TaxID=1460676 RepID=A0ABW4U266_9SPHN